MYHLNEIPKFKVSIFYFDEEYNADIPNQLKHILREHDFYPPTFINVDKLTRGRYIRYADKMDSYLIDGYTQKGILYLGITDAPSLKASDFWQMEWQLTYHKFTSYHINAGHKPWNVLSFKITYNELSDESKYKRFWKCVYACIELLNPFYATMDDIDISVTMSQAEGTNKVTPIKYGEVNAIHWGNYFGPEYCRKYGLNAIKSLSGVSVSINGGILFMLSKSALDCVNHECTEKRKLIARSLGITPANKRYR